MADTWKLVAAKPLGPGYSWICLGCGVSVTREVSIKPPTCSCQMRQMLASSGPLKYSAPLPYTEEILKDDADPQWIKHLSNLQERQVTELEEELGEVLRQLKGPDWAKDPNFTDTPRRVAAYLMEHFRTPDQVARALSEMQSKTFPTEYTGMVTAKDITADGLCPHHLLPVSYTATVGYLPGSRVLGVSKLARLVRLFAEQPILQEDATEAIANALETLLETRGVGVVLCGRHSCMAIRGVRVAAAVITSSVRGVMRKNTAKAEFLSFARTSE